MQRLTPCLSPGLLAPVTSSDWMLATATGVPEDCPALDGFTAKNRDKVRVHELVTTTLF